MDIQARQPRIARRHPDNISPARISEIARGPEACLALFERLRYPNALVCPWCGVCEPSSRFVRHRSRPGLYTCGDCRKQFALTSGMAMHRTRLPLGRWLRAIWMVVSSSKGIAAKRLCEMLDVTYRVAWHLGHRIRAMMVAGALMLGAFGGIVELDKVYAGAPPPPVSPAPVGRATMRPMVLTMVERSGSAVMKRIETHSREPIEAAAQPHLDPTAALATDGLGAYRQVVALAGRSHLVVTHSAGEFVAHDPDGLRPPAHTNTAESLYNDLRRTVTGVRHWISEKHFDRYLSEVTWRWNNKDHGHLQRIATLLSS